MKYHADNESLDCATIYCACTLKGRMSFGTKAIKIIFPGVPSSTAAPMCSNSPPKYTSCLYRHLLLQCSEVGWRGGGAFIYFQYHIDNFFCRVCPNNEFAQLLPFIDFQTGRMQGAKSPYAVVTQSNL